MDYLQTTGDRLHDLELDRILARLRTLEAATAPSTLTPVPVAPTPILSSGVRSITPGTGTQISGDVILSPGTGLTTEQSGQTITISASASPAASVTAVATTGAVGASLLYARQDHVHTGVHALNGLLGDVTLVAGTNVTLTPSGNTVTIAATAGAATVVPAIVLVISPGSAAIAWAVPVALTEFNNGVHIYHARHDLTNATQVRLVLFAPASAAVTPSVVAQYSLNAGGTWFFLDGVSGPSLTFHVGAQYSAWVALTPGANADVLLRIAASGGDGATVCNFGSIYLQVK